MIRETLSIQVIEVLCFFVSVVANREWNYIITFEVLFILISGQYLTWTVIYIRNAVCLGGKFVLLKKQCPTVQSKLIKLDSMFKTRTYSKTTASSATQCNHQKIIYSKKECRVYTAVACALQLPRYLCRTNLRKRVWVQESISLWAFEKKWHRKENCMERYNSLATVVGQCGWTSLFWLRQFGFPEAV